MSFYFMGGNERPQVDTRGGLFGGGGYGGGIYDGSMRGLGRSPDGLGQPRSAPWVRRAAMRNVGPYRQQGLGATLVGNETGEAYQYPDPTGLGVDPTDLAKQIITGGARGGFESGAFPWMERSDFTAEAQENLNAYLTSQGYATVGVVDGVLGPKTCAGFQTASAWAEQVGDETNAERFAPPITCESFGTAPPCLRAPCLPTPEEPPALPGEPPTLPQVPQERGISTAAMFVGGLLIAGAAGAIYAATQKKKGR